MRLRTGLVLIGARGTDPVISEEGKMRTQAADNGGGGIAPPLGTRIPVQTPPVANAEAEWK